jgi:hypothetical protein
MRVSSVILAPGACIVARLIVASISRILHVHRPALRAGLMRVMRCCIA